MVNSSGTAMPRRSRLKVSAGTLTDDSVNDWTLLTLPDSQPLDSDLTAIAALSTTAYGRSLLTLADAAAAVVAVGAQPLDSDLTAIAALATTAYGRSLLTLADAPAVSTALALGRITALDANHLHAWECTDASGNLVDTGSSASLVNLTVTGTPTYAVPGIVGNCLQLGSSSTDGTAAVNYASALVSAFSDLPTGSVTIECWYKSTQQPVKSIAGVSIVGSYNFSMTGSVSDDALSFTSRGGSFTSTAKITNIQGGTPFTWYHIALVYDSGAGFTYGYLNGEIVARHSQSGNINWTNGTTPTFFVGNDTLNSSLQFTGQIARVRLSNIARSQAYLRGVYTKGIGL